MATVGRALAVSHNTVQPWKGPTVTSMSEFLGIPSLWGLLTQFCRIEAVRGIYFHLQPHQEPRYKLESRRVAKWEIGREGAKSEGVRRIGRSERTPRGAFWVSYDPPRTVNWPLCWSRIYAQAQTGGIQAQWVFSHAHVPEYRLCVRELRGGEDHCPLLSGRRMCI